MKGVVATAITVALIATTSVQGMESFLKQLPNGSKFAKALGHTASGYTAFGTAFLEAGTTWSPEFCKQTFPGSKLTNGQAFGDPCCTWKSGAAAPQSVSAFTTDPGQGTTCATDAKPSTAPAPAPAGGNNKPAPAPAGGNNKPAPAPAGGNNKPAPAPAGGNNKPAPAPAGGNNKPAPAPAGGNSKPSSGGKKPACKKKNRRL